MPDYLVSVRNDPEASRLRRLLTWASWCPELRGLSHLLQLVLWVLAVILMCRLTF